jgi:hypothetical protein
MPRRSPDPLDSMPDLADDGAMAAKRGRPAKAAEERRSEALGLRITAEEKAFLVDAAEAFGLPVSTFVLQAVRAYVASPMRPEGAPPSLAALLRSAADALDPSKK